MPTQAIQAYGIRETYHELGEHEFRVVLDPSIDISPRECSFAAFDPDGKPMESSCRSWGSKIKCKFKFGPETPDGVAVGRLVARGEQIGRFTWWVIK